MGYVRCWGGREREGRKGGIQEGREGKAHRGPCNLFPGVFIKVPIAVIKYQDQKQLEEERVYVILQVTVYP